MAEHDHFGRAAQHCHVSQPTLSGQIKKLEDQLGIALFERTNRRVLLTDMGRQLLPHARRILQEVDIIRETVETAQDPLAGKFRLGAFPTLSPYLFPAIVPEVKANLPKLRLILIEEKTAELLEKLRHGELDAALLALPVQDDLLHTEPLFDDPFLLAVPPDHPLAEQHPIRQEQLVSHRLLLLEEGHCLRDQALEVCQLHQIGEEQDFKATGLETLRQMVKAGTGITFMPQIAIKSQEEGIRYIPFAPPVPSRSIALVWRKTTPRAAMMEKLAGLIRACSVSPSLYT